MYEENSLTSIPQNSTVYSEPTDVLEIAQHKELTEVSEQVESTIVPELPELVETTQFFNQEKPEIVVGQDELTIPQEVNIPPLLQPQKNVLKGIESLNELQNLEVLRTEFASSTFKPKVILSYETISFNKACVNLLPNTRYVNVLIDRHKKRIIILPVSKIAKDALQWCTIAQNGEVKKRLCTAKKFGEKLYDMMQWVKENKYRILAYYQEIEGVKLLVFNLSECEIVVPEFVTTKTGKLVKRGKVYLPDTWVNGFGMPLTKHSEANAVELNAHYTLSDKDMDVTIKDVRVLGKIPTDEEIIMSQYRKEKLQEVLVNA
jgi:hypothetical protein